MVAKRVCTTERSSAKSSTTASSAACGDRRVRDGGDRDRARPVRAHPARAPTSVVVPERDSASDDVVRRRGGHLGGGERVGAPVPAALAQRRLGLAPCTSEVPQPMTQADVARLRQDARQAGARAGRAPQSVGCAADLFGRDAHFCTYIGRIAQKQALIARYESPRDARAERFGRILELLARDGTVTVVELAGDLGVSEATVRRDLQAARRAAAARALARRRRRPRHRARAAGPLPHRPQRREAADRARGGRAGGGRRAGRAHRRHHDDRGGARARRAPAASPSSPTRSTSRSSWRCAPT